jgi:hypothetical protein
MKVLASMPIDLQAVHIKGNQDDSKPIAAALTYLLNVTFNWIMDLPI